MSPLPLLAVGGVLVLLGVMLVVVGCSALAELTAGNRLLVEVRDLLHAAGLRQEARHGLGRELLRARLAERATK